MTYQETLDFLYNSLPALEKKGWGAYKPGLTRTFQLAELAGKPHQDLRIIHIGGTNGKGSVSSMIASVLMESGYKVGLFTSPHLKDFRERITINGIQIPEKTVVDFVQEFKGQAKLLEPSFFEYTFVMALDYFKRQEVDFSVIEVGLGGRLDCTNIVMPELSVITTIGLDHQKFLGNSIEEIAAEKAGIIKADIPVIVGNIKKEARTVIENKAAAIGAPFYKADKNLPNEFLFIDDDYQTENRKIALKAIELLKLKTPKITDEAVKNGFLNYQKNTGLRGRMEWLSESPRILVDVAHNADGVSSLVKYLNRISVGTLRIVWGMSADKDVNEILSLLPDSANYYWCSAQNPRSLDSETLKNSGDKIGLIGQSFHSVPKALSKAISEYSEGDLIVVTGSVFVVAEAI